MRPAVFLDRDDTLIECRRLPTPAPPAKAGDLTDPALVRLLPGVAEGLTLLAGAGFALVVISNQGVVARGGATCERVEEINRRVSEAVVRAGGPRIDAFYFCPYHPQGGPGEFSREHPWRKPAPGMIVAASEELGLDLARSWLIGDVERDIEAGVAAGLRASRCLLIGEDRKLPDLQAAAEVVVAEVAGDRVLRGVEVAAVDLRPLEEGALDDARTRETVLASARSIAEQHGVRLVELGVADGALRLGVRADRMLALGFAAEVRRATNAWHRARTGSALWPGDAG
ncbi:MAG: HAD-IIIA family hydrolase [Leptolyngbya sp. PLA1]|nr:HAD-IIIA family hydrolase [Leptolyngbya sp. PLA1]